jgi:hypothetical protein
MVKRRGGENAFERPKKLGILLECKAAHQYRARVDFLVRRLCGKLGKEIHRAEIILSQKANKKRN